MNRQQRRLVAHRGEQAEGGTAVAPPRPEPQELRFRQAPAAPPRRTTPRQFLHEVNVEMRKVAWPTKLETINYSTVVFVTLAVLMAFIFGLDIAFSKLAVYLF